MANFFDLFNPFRKSGQSKQGPAAQFLKPIKARETVPGQLAFKELEKRLQGLGVGFDPNVIKGATAPFAAARREGFQRREVPAISSAASARGLGRSTIPVAQIGQAAQTAERDIEQRVADLSVKDQVQRRAEINDALARLQISGQTEAGTVNLGKAANVREFERQQEIPITESQLQQQSLDNILNVGTLAAKAVGLGGFAPTSLFPSPPIDTSGKTTGASAKVAIAGEELDPEDLAELIRMLQGGE